MSVLNKTIVLCGLPGSGKSTLGQIVAKHWNLSFIDTDRQLEALYTKIQGKRRSCRQIYFQEGEKAFRQWEHQVICGLSGAQNSVIAIGGGGVLQPENVAILRSIGTLIYLKTCPKTILKTLLRHGVPAYLDPKNPVGSYEILAEQRQRLYEKVCDLTIHAENLLLFLGNAWNSGLEEKKLNTKTK